MKILVIGGTGGIGQHVITQAIERGHEVTALARNPSGIRAKSDRLKAVAGDVLKPETLEAAMAGQQAVLSSLGVESRKPNTVRSDGTRNVIAAMKEHGVRRLIAISALGVGDSLEATKRAAFVFGRIIIPLLLKDTFADMGRMEQFIRESDLDWTIVRPTGLSDKPLRSKVTSAVKIDKVGVSIPRADVAAFMLDQIDRPELVRQVAAVW